MTDTNALPAAPVPASDGPRIGGVLVRVLAGVGLLVAGAEIVSSVFGVVASATSTGDDPLDGIGYLIAILLGVPGVLAAVGAGLGMFRPTSTVGLVGAVAALPVALLGPVVLLYCL